MGGRENSRGRIVMERSGMDKGIRMIEESGGKGEKRRRSRRMGWRRRREKRLEVREQLDRRKR